ncbi:unnamed protein product [Camellia sinensis]
MQRHSSAPDEEEHSSLVIMSGKAEAEGNEPINEQAVANIYGAMRSDINQIYSKITELEMEASEHSLVMNAIKPLDPSRRCYRMIGGVLVERTIKEVLPAVQRNKEGLEEVIARLNEALEKKKKEVADFEAKYKIRIRKSDEVQDDAGRKEGSAQGVLVGPADCLRKPSLSSSLVFLGMVVIHEGMIHMVSIYILFVRINKVVDDGVWYLIPFCLMWLVWLERNRRTFQEIPRTISWLESCLLNMIEELISRGQQVDAVHFTFEVGLENKFPPVPLLRAFLKDAKKAATAILEDHNNSSRVYLAARKEQSALRAVIKCIEEYKLEAEFPSEHLKKRLEQLEKTKSEKRKPSTVLANKRTRANNGGPMPPAKAGRSTNAYVSSFPAPPTFVRSPSHTQYPYPASPTMYGSRSPPTNPYAYSPEAASPPLVGSYPGAPMNYAPYGGYGNGVAPMAYQAAYYR